MAKGSQNTARLNSKNWQRIGPKDNQDLVYHGMIEFSFYVLDFQESNLLFAFVIWML